MTENATLLALQARTLEGNALETFLREACGDNATLRAEVERLIGKARTAETFFEAGLEGDTITDAFTEENATECEGDLVGPYTLRQKIGEGGFGVVWMAEQSKPISRMVALKVVKAGMDTKQVLARFEAERQALAMMDHPNIAQVLDAGATTTGRPYFAMELVKGIPITEFCNDQRFDHRRRLKLFQDVCSAMNHAHQKGVIHRDLKPSNVMVTLHGNKPVPKVIDFGIAKATQQKLTDKTLFTRFDQFLGTPVYMSPEQATMSGLDIDTRADIYGLGILLYELLAGEPPFDSKSLLSAGYDEMRRIIREDDPPRPSTKLTQTQSDFKERLHVNATALKGELDWIVMKAIEKDRSRRYATANAFAADIGRYLKDEPVQAAAPSASYRFRKFACRNKAALSVAAAIALLLVAATSVSVGLALRANNAEHLATQRLLESQFSEGLSWMLRAQVAEKEGKRFPDTLLNAARAIGFDGQGRPAEELSTLPRLIKEPHHAEDYQKARQWIRDQGLYLPIWNSGAPSPSRPVTRLDLSPLGRWLATTDEDGTVRLWDFSKEASALDEHPSILAQPAQSVAFHPSGRHLTVAGEGSVRMWDLNQRTFLDARVGSVAHLLYSPDGERLAGSTFDGTVRVWDEESFHETVVDAGLKTVASDLAFTADGAMLAVASRETGVRIYHFGDQGNTGGWLPNWESWSEDNPRESSKITSVAFSPDMSTLATGSTGGDAHLWDVATTRLSGEMDPNDRLASPIQDLEFSSSGRQLIAASASGLTRLWTVDENRLTTAATLVGRSERVTQIRYLPGETILATAEADGSVLLWDVSGKRGEKPSLYRYLENDWYSMNTREQGTSWQSGVGFLNFPDDSIITSWQRGTLENSRLFDWLLRSKQWKAAAAIASEDASSQRKDRLEKALRDHAAAAAGLKKWREARQLLSRLKHQTETPETATLVESIEHQLPASEGIDFENEEGVAMVWCDPGTFTMGSPEQEAGREADEPLIPVTIESGFWIGKYEITNAQYGEIMGTNAHKESDYAGSQLPASDISSVDAIEYCRRLTVRERIRGAIPSGWEYHLPTEEQWEYACRAGSQTAYCFGEDMDGLDEYAWHADNGPGHPQPVGQKKANAWGLHDMHGNVHEWCRNYVEGEFGIPYTGVIDNSHPDIRRVYRGGSFYNGPEACRSAVRGWWKPLAYWGIGGFRVALVPLTESPQSP